VAKNKVKVVDKGFNALRARLVKAAKKPLTMTVGVHSDAGNYPNGMAVAHVAAGKELGFFKPQRPFLRPVFDAAKAQHRPTLRLIAQRYAFGEGAVGVQTSLRRDLRTYGNTLAKLMRKVAPKKTGRLRRSIKVKVR